MDCALNEALLEMEFAIYRPTYSLVMLSPESNRAANKQY